MFANNAQLAGHVDIGDWTILGGFAGVHQFVKVGAHVMAGIQRRAPGRAAVRDGRATRRAARINAEGLKRRGFTPS